MAWRMPVALLAGAALFAASTYQAEMAQWRRVREAELRRDGSWLTVAGLFWLRDGVNRFGKDAANEIWSDGFVSTRPLAPPSGSLLRRAGTKV
jgi:hypothetical protein